MTSRRWARAKRRSPCAVSRGRGDWGHFRPAIVERDRRSHADRDLAQAACRFNEISLLLGIGGRTPIAARQGFADVNKDMVAVTGTATIASALLLLTSASSRVGGARERHCRVEERLGLAEE
jgi:hypothetical protein